MHSWCVPAAPAAAVLNSAEWPGGLTHHVVQDSTGASVEQKARLAEAFRLVMLDQSRLLRQRQQTLLDNLVSCVPAACECRTTVPLFCIVPHSSPVVSQRPCQGCCERHAS